MGDGVTNATSAITTCLAAAAGGELRFPTGTYLVAGSGSIFTASAKGTHIVGPGDYSATIKLAPTAAATVITASAGAAILYGFSIDGISFTSADTTFTKTAVSLIDTSGARVHIAVGPIGAWHDAGLTSIGVHIFGRDLGHVSSSGGIAADRPVLISRNPNSFLDLDLWVLGGDDHLLTLANGHPNIELEDIYASNNSFRNLSMNMGTEGLVATGTLNANVSTDNSVDTARCEQMSSATGYCISWALSSSRNLSLRTITAGTPGRGIRVRSNGVTIENSSYSFTGIGLDIAGCDAVLLNRNFFQGDSTAVTTGMRQIMTIGQQASVPAAAAMFEYWISTSNVNAMAFPMSSLSEYPNTLIGTLVGSNGASVTVPGLSGNATYGSITLAFNGAAHGGGTYIFSPSGISLVGGESNTVAGIPGANHVGLNFNSAGNITLFNDYVASINYRISVKFFF